MSPSSSCAKEEIPVLATSWVSIHSWSLVYLRSAGKEWSEKQRIAAGNTCHRENRRPTLCQVPPGNAKAKDCA